MTRVRIVMFLALAACGGPARREPPRPAPVDDTAPVERGPQPVHHPLRLAATAPHAGSIVLLTASPEGDAVLSIDEVGAVRLWPALDGSREPLVVHLPPATALALGHRGDGYTAVARDEGGGLHIAKLDAEGRTLAHSTVAPDPAVMDIAMTHRGLLAWRADHHVLLVDGDGKVQADLATEPQQRIVDITVRGDRALALLELEGGIRKVRWLALQPALAWGAWIDHADIDTAGASLALAPDGKHFALASGTDVNGQVAIHEAATGTHVTVAQRVGVAGGLAFVDDTLLSVVTRERGLFWLTAAKATTVLVSNATAPLRQREALAAGAGGIAIAPRDAGLMLFSQHETQYLGYGATWPQSAAAGPDGSLLVVVDRGAFLLDANLRDTSSPNLHVEPRSQIVSTWWVGGDDWLVESVHPLNDLSLVNVARGQRTVLVDKLTVGHHLAYEPSTQTVTLSLGRQAQVARLDLAARSLVPLVPARDRPGYASTVFVPLVPALARGHQLVQLDIVDGAQLRWFTSFDKPAASVTVKGSYLGADASGRVYMWQSTPSGKLELAIYTDGTQTGTLPIQGRVSLWPDPGATRLGVTSDHAVSLYRGGSSQPAWNLDLDDVHEILWLGDGALALVHATGVARVDAATGAVTATRCGWQFGLSRTPHPLPMRGEPICAQLAR